jgi:hypothetical protein
LRGAWRDRAPRFFVSSSIRCAGLKVYRFNCSDIHADLGTACRTPSGPPGCRDHAGIHPLLAHAVGGPAFFLGVGMPRIDAPADALRFAPQQEQKGAGSTRSPTSQGTMPAPPQAAWRAMGGPDAHGTIRSMVEQCLLLILRPVRRVELLEGVASARGPVYDSRLPWKFCSEAGWTARARVDRCGVARGELW